MMAIFVLGVFETTSAPFALSGPFIPLSSEQMVDDGVRDADQPDNERDVADYGDEDSTASTTQTSGQ